MELETFRGVVPFVAVAEEKSFRRAATRLGISPAAVSKAVQTLEAGVGQPLFTRTTRAVSLTRAGELFFERCRQAMASVSGGRDALAAAHAEPSGGLVVSAPFVVVTLLVPVLALLSSRFPRLTFDVRVTDQLSRFAEESVDVAVRVGTLAQSSLVARRLRRTRLVTIASPAYLARAGTPVKAAQLAQHRCLMGRAPNNKTRPFLFATGPLLLEPTLLVDHGPTLVDAALAGLGVTQAFDFMVADLVRDGRLVELFAGAAAEGPDIHAVCAPGRRASANVRAAFDALAEGFAKTAP
ncbi:MAG: LysR family transcriptional regulator [Archangium sp.]|nr:LysR family transcriptional regulator [Archangium sp.]